MSNQPTIAHIGIAVTDLGEALGFYREVLGFHQPTFEQADGARIACLTFGQSQVELLEPEDPHGPIAKFLAKRGPGIHHVCYRVPDLDAALEACRSSGYRLIDEEPRIGVHGARIAFIHPKAAGGTLIELTE